ncbi:DUF3152 domain-containing protein [Streptomyces sp. SM14]|uniref:DUF3152 domain-containing protein n=1 Tax=Streptomyces sp. SM14 TaxID=1736045 RepID=UPI002156361D|nr:DUF3152 domain-containing protein [Streptomyces sp. SM14]
MPPRRTAASARRVARLRRTILVLTLAVGGTAGVIAMSGSGDDGDDGDGRPAGSGDTARADRTEDHELPRASGTQRPSPNPTAIPVPESGPGTFTSAVADAETVGPSEGTVYRYQVQVEDNIELDPDAAAAEIHTILGHERGWTNDGDSAFALVADGDTDLNVMIATPDTVDELCGRYGLDTQGEVNCRIDDDVVVNLRRWVEGSPEFDGPIGEYRALIINHEVGHRIGHGHAGCPGEGELAPAMMQQIRGLDGCVANAWPYGEDGEFIDGPWVP